MCLKVFPIFKHLSHPFKCCQFEFTRKQTLRCSYKPVKDREGGGRSGPDSLGLRCRRAAAWSTHRGALGQRAGGGCHVGPKGPGVSPFLLAGGSGLPDGNTALAQPKVLSPLLGPGHSAKCQFFREGRSKPHTRGSPMCIDIQNLCVLANIVEPRKISAGNKKPCDFQSWTFPDVYGVTHRSNLEMKTESTQLTTA